MSQTNRQNRKKFEKIVRRRRIHAHIRRVGRRLYESERTNVVCKDCKQIRNIRCMTLDRKTFGLGPCRFCVQEKEKANESAGQKA